MALWVFNCETSLEHHLSTHQLQHARILPFLSKCWSLIDIEEGIGLKRIFRDVKYGDKYEQHDLLFCRLFKKDQERPTCGMLRVLVNVFR